MRCYISFPPSTKTEVTLFNISTKPLQDESNEAGESLDENLVIAINYPWK